MGAKLGLSLASSDAATAVLQRREEWLRAGEKATTQVIQAISYLSHSAPSQPNLSSPIKLTLPFLLTVCGFCGEFGAGRRAQFASCVIRPE